MYLLEYQAKELAKSAGIPVPAGEIASTPAEAVRAAERIGPCFVKAQIKSGGRFKAGLVKAAASPAEAGKAGRQILGKAHNGEIVRRILVEERLEVSEEIYLGIILDFANAHPVVLASRKGGVDIETLAGSDSKAIIEMDLDPLQSKVAGSRWVEFWKKTKLASKPLPMVAKLSATLLKLFYETDAFNLELNPLVLTSAGAVVAADVRLIVDDAALFRHPELRNDWTVEHESLEAQASEMGVTYVPLDPQGSVGIIGGGAGLSMATIDAVVDAGQRPIAFLDLGGGISAAGMAEAIRIMLKSGDVKAIIINAFGGINNCEVMARGIAGAYEKIGAQTALVVKMRGHSQEAGWKILEELGIDVIRQGPTDEAVRLLINRMPSKPEQVDDDTDC